MYTAELPKGWYGCNVYRLYFNGKLQGLLYLSKEKVAEIVNILNTHPKTD